MTTPTDSEILSLLDRLDAVVADDLETLHGEFKPWTNPRESMMCFFQKCQS